MKWFSPENLIRQKERKSLRRRGDLIKDKRKCRPGGQGAAQQNPYAEQSIACQQDIRSKTEDRSNNSVITTFCHRSLNVFVSLDDEVKNLNHNS